MNHPILFYTFANDLTNPNRYLKALEGEKRALEDIWGNIRDTYQYHIFEAAPKAEHWREDFMDCYKHMVGFHYGGHASSQDLLYEKGKSGNISFKRGNFIELLKECKQLKFVFLNACNTLSFAGELLRMGVPVVIATKTEVDDRKAAEFSEEFYRYLIKGESLQSAFTMALSGLYPNTKDESKVYFTSREIAGILQEEENDVSVYRGMGGLRWKGQANEPHEYHLFIQHDQAANWTLNHNAPQKRTPQTYLSAYYDINLQQIVGRFRELRELRKYLETYQQVLLVNGIGGIGKTTLAKYYVQKYGFKYDHIIWVDVLPERNKAGGDVLSAFVSYQNNILNHLELKFEPKASDEEKFHALMARLGKLEGNNLLVIDNAGEKIIEVQEHLPKAPRWKTLVTSRNSFARFKVYSLDILPKEDAQALFLQYYPQAKDDSLLPLLLKRIGYHTLTIELLAKTLHSHKRLTLPTLWKAIDAEGLQAANRKKVSINHPVFKTPIKANDCVLKLFSLDLLSKEEITLLLQFAVLPPMALSYTVITDLLAIENETEDDFEELLDELAQKGWLSTKEDTYSCHQIIQEVIRQQIPPTVENCEPLIESISSKLAIDQTKDNPIDKFPWVPYGKSLIQWIETNTKEASFTLSVLRSNLGGVLRDLGDYQGTKEQLEAALASDLLNFGENDPNVARVRSNLGTVLSDLGDYQGAREQFQAALESAIRNFGENHPAAAISRSNLGLVLRYLGDYQGAKEQLQAALASDLRNFGENHPNVARVRSNLGTVLLSLEDYQGAKEQLEAALESAIRNFGENHPTVAISRSNLGGVLRSLGDYQGAKEQLETALESDLRNFGENHPKIAKRYHNLGLVYLDMVDLKLALFYLEEAYKIRNRLLGEKHPHTIKVAESIMEAKLRRDSL